MSWNIFEVLGGALDVLDLLSSGSGSSSDRKSLNYGERPQSKKSRRLKNLKADFIIFCIPASVVLYFIVFKDPLPAENYGITLFVTSLIGVALSFLVFFVMNVLEVFYFKSIFRLLFVCGSVIAFFIALVMCVYYKSGVFI
ncbi:branched-chain amino acid ABC transporter substrate-binding protein [Chryseobacterium sp.]|uniref:branched-chain amino acid ABC transporter substrate-binding protein n=1 Tax=Chryseobacterium sp. TaxID=1871047 RepID=UPI00321C113F